MRTVLPCRQQWTISWRLGFSAAVMSCVLAESTCCGGCCCRCGKGQTGSNDPASDCAAAYSNPPGSTLQDVNAALVAANADTRLTLGELDADRVEAWVDAKKAQVASKLIALEMRGAKAVPVCCCALLPFATYPSPLISSILCVLLAAFNRDTTHCAVCVPGHNCAVATATLPNAGRRTGFVPATGGVVELGLLHLPQELHDFISSGPVFDLPGAVESEAQRAISRLSGGPDDGSGGDDGGANAKPGERYVAGKGDLVNVSSEGTVTFSDACVAHDCGDCTTLCAMRPQDVT